MKKSFFVVFFISALIFAGVFYVGSNFLDAIDDAGSSEFRGDELEENNIIEQKVAHELTFLLVGIDENEPDDPSELSRTDTMMIGKVNFDNGDVDILSIPRDSRVFVQGQPDKINHAYAYGGITLTMKTLRDFLGIDLDYYVSVDFNAVEDIVDAIGGIDLDVPMDMDFSPLGVYIHKGRQHLSGKEAIYFCRFRSGYINGDLGRVETQQYFMKELVKQVLSPSNITKLPSLLKTFKKDVKTNIPFSTVGKLALKAGNIKPESLKTHTVPGTDGYLQGVSYFFPDGEGVNRLVWDLFSEYKTTEGDYYNLPYGEPENQ